MLRPIICLLVAGLTLPSAQEKDAKRLQELLAKCPTPAKKDGKLAEVDKEATDAAVAELLKDTVGSVAALVDLLAAKGAEVQARHALHALVMRVGGDKNAAARQAAARALAATLDGGRSKEIQTFVVRELQLGRAS